VSTIDFACASGAQIPIEERGAEELGAGDTPVANPAFDVTPARLISGIISERGMAPAGAGSVAIMNESTAISPPGACHGAGDECLGINRGSAGNVSARCAGGFVITPTGMAYEPAAPPTW
jgi:hypothetical protein